MAAAARGNIAVVEQLIAAGADLYMKAKNQMIAREFGSLHDEIEVCEILDSYK